MGYQVARRAQHSRSLSLTKKKKTFWHSGGCTYEMHFLGMLFTKSQDRCSIWFAQTGHVTRGEGRARATDSTWLWFRGLYVVVAGRWWRWKSGLLKIYWIFFFLLYLLSCSFLIVIVGGAIRISCHTDHDQASRYIAATCLVFEPTWQITVVDITAICSLFWGVLICTQDRLTFYFFAQAQCQLLPGIPAAAATGYHNHLSQLSLYHLLPLGVGTGRTKKIKMNLLYWP